MSLNQQLNMDMPIGKSFIEKYNGMNADIMKVLEGNFATAVEQTKDIAPKFLGKTDLDTVFNLWAFLRTKIIYKKDPFGKQQIRLPNRFIYDGSKGIGGDCKSYSLFSAAVLYNLGFNVYFQYVAYTIDKIKNAVASHVFVKAEKNGIIYYLDGCNKKFNIFGGSLVNEKKMQIETLSGIPGSTSYTRRKRPKMSLDKERKIKAILRHELKNRAAIQEIEEYIGKKGDGKRFFQKLGKGLKKLGKGLKKISLAPARNAFLALIRLNARGLAYKFAAAYKVAEAKNKATAFWEKLGGDPKKFWDSVKKGSKKKPLGGSKRKKETINGAEIGVVGTVTIGALLVSAGTILAAAKPIFQAIKPILKKKDPKAAADFDAVDEKAGGEAGLEKDIVEAGGEVKALPPGTEVEKDPQLDKAGKAGLKLSTPVLIGLAAAGAAGIYLLTKKSKK